jgi:hypothetical protein
MNLPSSFHSKIKSTAGTRVSLFQFKERKIDSTNVLITLVSNHFALQKKNNFLD